MPIPTPAFFQKMNETQRLWASVGAIVLVGGLLGTFWGLGLREAGALSDDVGQLKSSLSAAQKKLDDFPDLQRRYRESLSEDRRLTQLLPDQNALDRAFEILENIEEQAGKAGYDADFTLLSGKTVQKPQGRKPSDPSPVDEFTLEIEAAGSWPGFVSFLDGIDHADRLMTVKSFKTTERDKKNPAACVYKIVLTLYVMKPPPAAGAKK